jgi:hypothetical protein
MGNIEQLLPVIKEDLNNIKIDSNWVDIDKSKYEKILLILYSTKGQREIPNKQKISSYLKKQLLVNILNKNDSNNDLFLYKLKRILPEGLCTKEIMTDSEYEALKKEFSING